MLQITHRWQKGILVILVSLSLMTGGYEFKINNKYPQFLACMECPDWKYEVKQWRNDNNYKLKIWTYPKWTIDLN